MSPQFVFRSIMDTCTGSTFASMYVCWNSSANINENGIFFIQCLRAYFYVNFNISKIKIRNYSGVDLFKGIEKRGTDTAIIQTVSNSQTIAF
jgi:hypothetical protein